MNRLAQLLVELAELLAEGEHVHVRIERGPVYAQLRIGPTDEKPGSRPMTLDSNGHQTPRGKMFSSIEEAILKAGAAEWQTAAQLAEKTGQSHSTWFCAILSNLVEREYLDGGRNGYRLLPDAIATAPAGSARAVGRMYGPLEEKIMQAATPAWQTRLAIAEKIGETVSSSFSSTMANLAERGCLESGHRGYRLPEQS
ncbi:MAG TPA: hypothetical protein VMG10_32795 [Gemmataceae bacterium]|nr:hypothetical protein [Gemmataceae bacterium]